MRAIKNEERELRNSQASDVSDNASGNGVFASAAEVAQLRQQVKELESSTSG